MIWFTHKKYTSEFYAAGLAELRGLARLTRRGMTAVAGLAILAMVALQAGVIYGL